MELILRLINYFAYNWNICGEPKNIGLLLGMHMGYTKDQCFLRLWDSRDDEQHYTKKKFIRKVSLEPVLLGGQKLFRQL